MSKEDLPEKMPRVRPTPPVAQSKIAQPAAEEIPEEREPPQLVQLTPYQAHSDISAEFPTIQALVKANSALGSCLAKQLKTVKAADPARACYDYFFDLGLRIQQQM